MENEICNVYNALEVAEKERGLIREIGLFFPYHWRRNGISKSSEQREWVWEGRALIKYSY